MTITIFELAKLWETAAYDLRSSGCGNFYPSFQRAQDAARAFASQVLDGDPEKPGPAFGTLWHFAGSTAVWVVVQHRHRHAMITTLVSRERGDTLSLVAQQEQLLTPATP